MAPEDQEEQALQVEMAARRRHRDRVQKLERLVGEQGSRIGELERRLLEQDARSRALEERLELQQREEREALSAMLSSLEEKCEATLQGALERWQVHVASDFERAHSEELDSLRALVASLQASHRVVGELGEAKQKLPVGILFPGEGSAYVGMLKTAKDLRPCKELIDRANEVMGFDLLALCLDGPEQALETTRNQPATFLANCCALEVLRLERPDVVDSAAATAGYSVGLYNALWFAGVMSFEDALRAVRDRADAMAEAAKRQPQAMLSVAGLELHALESLCVEASKPAPADDGEDTCCQVASHLFPKGYTCAGDMASVRALKELAEQAGAVQARLLANSSGAFHSSFMEPACQKLLRSLGSKVASMNAPRVDLYTSVRATARRVGTEPQEIADDLVQEVKSPILWEESVRAMVKDGVSEFFECGPNGQLTAMMKRISGSMWGKTHSVEV